MYPVVIDGIKSGGNSALLTFSVEPLGFLALYKGYNTTFKPLNLCIDSSMNEIYIIYLSSFNQNIWNRVGLMEIKVSEKEGRLVPKICNEKKGRFITSVGKWWHL